jgi:inner membrane protein
MDPITHALSGAVIRNFGFKKSAALAVLVISAVIPDIDFATGFWGDDLMLRYHRGLTHGVLALLVVPMAIGLIFRKKEGGVLYYWFLATLGYGTHLALDVTNHYGTRLMAPLDWQLVSADLTFVVEPYIIVGFALCILIGYMNADRARTVTFVTMLALVLYVGVKHHYHEKTEEFLRASMDEHIIETVSPLPNDILRWWFIARNGDEMKTGVADLFTEKIYVHKTYDISNNDPAIERSKQFEVVKNFLYFAKYPYAEVQAKGNVNVVKWRELSFAYAPGERFTATVNLDKDGRLIGSEVRL